VPGIDDPHSAYTTPATVARFIAAARGTSPEWVEQRFVHARAYLTAEELADAVPTVEALRSQGYGASSLTTLLTSASSTQEFLGGVRLVLGVTVACF